MSQANLNQFLAKVMGDAKLQDQLKNITDQNAFTQSVIRVGKDNGYQFTADDVDVGPDAEQEESARRTERGPARPGRGRPSASDQGRLR